MRSSAIVIVLLTLAGCHQSPVATSSISRVDALRVAQATEADYGSGDVGKIMSHYAPEAVSIDTSQPSPSDDRGALTASTKTFVSEKPADYHVSDRHIQVLDGNTFVSSGLANFTVEAGTARPTVGVRFSQVYERQLDGSWKIANEHFSLPPEPGAEPQ
jgi:hypothetical protein